MTDCEKYRSGSITEEQAEAHLEECEECRAAQEKINGALKECISAPQKDGMSLADSVMAKIASNDTTTLLSEKKHPRIPYATIAAAVLVIFVFSLSKTGIATLMNKQTKYDDAEIVECEEDGAAEETQEAATEPMYFYSAKEAPAKEADAGNVNDLYVSADSLSLNAAGKTEMARAKHEEEICDEENAECTFDRPTKEEFRKAVSERIKELDFEGFVLWLNENAAGSVPFEKAEKVGYESFASYVLSLEDIFEQYGEQSFEMHNSGS